ncbi:hypothetical protein JZ751_025241 [Albula glossodonta]|uniref:Uncharacterized protein n=1 Tax=Albula glossodonta TaxID=121402 RepID=A0A8T2NFL9_9TELE|nr:hypothetical protein JZ751_025241 [Albula glossodonta]
MSPLSLKDDIWIAFFLITGEERGRGSRGEGGVAGAFGWVGILDSSFSHHEPPGGADVQIESSTCVRPVVLVPESTDKHRTPPKLGLIREGSENDF